MFTTRATLDQHVLAGRLRSIALNFDPYRRLALRLSHAIVSAFSSVDTILQASRTRFKMSWPDRYGSTASRTTPAARFWELWRRQSSEARAAGGDSTD
jgi:hypothetical protein